MNGLWYCPAYCTAANQIRVFRVDRIKEIIEEKPYPKGKYPIPASIQEYLEKAEVKNDYHMKIQLTDIGVKRCESECLLISRKLAAFVCLFAAPERSSQGRPERSSGNGIRKTCIKAADTWVQESAFPS